MDNFFCQLNPSNPLMYDEDDIEGEMSEEEYDALNNETFGSCEGFDWEQDHEMFAEELENSRRPQQLFQPPPPLFEAPPADLVPTFQPFSNASFASASDSGDIDFTVSSQLEDSLNRLVLDEPEHVPSDNYQPAPIRPQPPLSPSSVWPQEFNRPSFLSQSNVGQFMANLQQPIGPNVANIQSPIGPNLANIQSPMGPSLANIQQPMGPNIANIQQPLGPNIANIQQPMGPNIANIQQPMGPNLAPNNMAPNNMAPNNMAPNNIAPNNMGLNNMAPNNIAPNNMGLNNIAPNNMGLNNMGIMPPPPMPALPMPRFFQPPNIPNVQHLPLHPGAQLPQLQQLPSPVFKPKNLYTVEELEKHLLQQEPLAESENVPLHFQVIQPQVGPPVPHNANNPHNRSYANLDGPIHNNINALIPNNRAHVRPPVDCVSRPRSLPVHPRIYENNIVQQPMEHFRPLDAMNPNPQLDGQIRIPIYNPHQYHARNGPPSPFSPLRDLPNWPELPGIRFGRPIIIDHRPLRDRSLYPVNTHPAHLAPQVPLYLPPLLNYPAGGTWWFHPIYDVFSANPQLSEDLQPQQNPIPKKKKKKKNKKKKNKPTPINKPLHVYIPPPSRKKWYDGPGLLQTVEMRNRARARARGNVHYRNRIMCPFRLGEQMLHGVLGPLQCPLPPPPPQPLAPRPLGQDGMLQGDNQGPPGMQPHENAPQLMQMDQILVQLQRMHQQQMAAMHVFRQERIEPPLPPRSEEPPRIPPGFNNVSTPMVMTSQNMVEFIQNNHPLLNFNNANNVNNNFSAGSTTGSARHHAARPNRPSYHNANGDTESNGIPTEDDPYTGMMTPREKSFLINILLMQISSMTPYIDDYYYTVWNGRRPNDESDELRRAHRENQQNHPLYATQVRQEYVTRQRLNSLRHNSTSEDTTPRAYVPAQFENSLGRLQCGSVTAPRMLIDVDVVQSEPANNMPAGSRASSVNNIEAPQIQRARQLFLDIEGLYIMILRLEELDDPLALATGNLVKEREERARLLALEAAKEEEDSDGDDGNLFLKNIEAVQRKQKELKDKSMGTTSNQPTLVAKNLLDENRDELINKMFSVILAEDKLPHMLNIKKGKILICRFVTKVNANQIHLRVFWNRLFRFAAHELRRDDGALDVIIEDLRRYIDASVGWPAILDLCSVLAEGLDPANTPYMLSSPFVMSCICVLVEKAETVSEKSDTSVAERQWSKFLKSLARTLKMEKVPVARPIDPLPRRRLEVHILLLQSRSTIEILQRGQTSTEFSGLSKQDLLDQLIKHLC